MMKKHFDERLLDHIRCGRNDEANAMLTEELAQSAQRFHYSSAWCINGTLLHHAAQYNNAVIARKLIELGADVDRIGGVMRTTPLGIALFWQCTAVVKVLLDADAKIGMVDGGRGSALLKVLSPNSVDSESFKLLVCKLRTKASTSDEVADFLIQAGCDMSYAATLRDLDVLECMLKRGVGVSSGAATEHGGTETALFTAVKLNDVNLADWLVRKGIDVEAQNEEGLSALTKAVERGNTDMVRLLLECGAYPDVREDHDYSPLRAAFMHLDQGPDEIIMCAELLFQHGASLENVEALRRMFYWALHFSCDKAVKLLIAHLAMLEMLGQPVDKSFMEYDGEYRGEDYREKMSELQKYYEPCQQVLKIEMFERMSLLDLLKTSDRKMKLLVRNKTFMQKVERISSMHNLKERYSYYYNSMMRRVEKASRVVRLENETILVIYKLFKTNEHQFYWIARDVVECLNERDLENFVQL